MTLSGKSTCKPISKEHPLEVSLKLVVRPHEVMSLDPLLRLEGSQQTDATISNTLPSQSQDTAEVPEHQAAQTSHVVTPPRGSRACRSMSIPQYPSRQASSSSLVGPQKYER